MDRNKRNDWTDAVRERLEGRELTPSESLWDRIEAAPVAPRVRRLPAWAGALAGVAATAAAVAAVLLLRPSGAPEPGRIDVVQTAAVPAQPSAAAEEALTPPAEDVPNAAAPQQPTAAARRPLVAQAIAPKAAPLAMPDAAEEEPIAAPDAADEKPLAAAAEEKAEDKAHTTVNQVQKVAAEETLPTMSIDEYLAQEGDGRQTGKRRLSAAVYAAGMPSADFMFNKDYDMDIQFLGVSYDNTHNGGSVSDITGSLPSGSVTNDPEKIDGYDPLKYNDSKIVLNNLPLNHSKPVSFGAAVTLPLTDHLFLESGAYYSYLHSTIVGGQDQYLHSVGIPLKLGWRFNSSGRISLSLSAGAKAEKCVYAVSAGQKYKEPGIQAAGVASAAIQYNITNSLGIFFAPELSYWLNGTKLITYNTVNPSNLSLKAGLNITLNR